MDESWRIPIGSMVSRRKFTEEARTIREGLHPDDFRDVFGGPPRTVLLRRFSGDLSSGTEIRSTTLYDEIFRPAGERGLPAARGGRNLPGFSIPTAARGGLVRTEQGFYDDIFGSGDGGGGERRSRSRSKSKSKSSSVLSSEDLSPQRPSIPEDPTLSSFASKLRPITIPSRRASDSSPSSTISGGEQNSQGTIPCYPARSCFMDFQEVDDSNSSNKGSTTHPFRQRHQNHRSTIGFPCCFTLEPSFRRGGSIKRHGGGGGAEADNSPSSSSLVIQSSSVLAASNSNSSNSRVSNYKWREQIERELKKVAVRVEEEGADIGFVIKIDGNRSRSRGETEGAAALDEAIAWVKEKFWNQQASNNGSFHDQLVTGDGSHSPPTQLEDDDKAK